jgi:hypothetical protein
MPVLAAAQGVRSESSAAPARTTNDTQRLQSFYPVFDRLDSGAGLTGGVGMRRSLGGGRMLDMHYATSLRGYVGAGIDVVLPELAEGRVALTFGAQYREAPRMSFFGVGVDEPDARRTSFELRRFRLGADVTYRPGGSLFVDATAAAVLFGSEDGDGPYPSTEDLFNASQVPGLRTSPTFVHTGVGVGVDSLVKRGSATHGRYVRVSVGQWQALGGHSFSFTQADAEAVQHIAVFRDDSVLTLRGLATVTGTDDSHDVPHYLLPSLGGSGSLRGYGNFRFQDRHRVFVCAEYRVMPTDRFEMAVFADAGTVAEKLRAFDLGKFQTSVGVGTRIRGPRSSSLGFAVARSVEGYRYYFSFSPKF